MLFDTDVGGVSLPEIANSLRLNGSSSFLSRAVGASSSTTTLSYFIQFKLSKIGGADQVLLEAGPSGGERSTLIIDSNGRLNYSLYVGSTLQNNLVTNRVFRDAAAWYSVLFVLDTTNSIAADRIRFYVNGIRENSFASVTYPTQDAASYLCNSVSGGAHAIGKSSYAAVGYFDGYITYACLVDNQAKMPTDFAYSDSNGQWRSLPKSQLAALISSGGVNSFFLPFDNGASTVTLGYDASSKANNWTLTNMVRDGSVDDCWSYDTPTNNFATLNPLLQSSTLSNGALTVVLGTTFKVAPGSMSIVAQGTNGFYWESMCTAGAALQAGIVKATQLVDPASNVNQTTTGWVMWRRDGNVYNEGSVVALGVSWAVNDVLGWGLKDGGLYLFKNGVALNGGSPVVTGKTGEWYPFWGNANSGGTDTHSVNFGQRPVAFGAFDSASGGYFRYTPPAGFKALCTKNLPIPSIIQPKKHFDVLTWTGAGGTSRTFSGLQFRPGLISTKCRSGAYYPVLFDEVCGTGNTRGLSTATTDAEGMGATAGSTANYGYVTSFNNDGFAMQVGVADKWYVDLLNATYVAWLWKAGGAAVTNNDGSISSQVSANPEAGFSIVTYTGTGANATVGHGLGVAPKVVIVKSRNGLGWYTYHASLTDATYHLLVNSTAAQAVQAGAWNSTAPNSSTISVGTLAGTNGNTTPLVAYCFAEVPGFSKFGSYVAASAANGPFVYCGFRPRWVMIKLSSGASFSWAVFDSERNKYNLISGTDLFANLSNAEQTLTGIDFLSNGFKIRTTNGNIGGTGTYIFMAFAESPFKYSNAR